MGPKKALAWMIKVESSMENSNAKLFGVDCWPIIRNTVLTIVLNSNRSYGRASNSKLSVLYNFFSSMTSLLNVNINDIFILSDNKFSEVIGGEKYLKDVYAIKNLPENNSKTIVVGLLNPKINDSVISGDACLSVYGLILISALVSRVICISYLFPGVKAYVSKVVNALVSVERDGEPVLDRNVLTSKLVRSLIFCIVSSYLFSFLLKRVRPESCYVQCYYSLLGMSFCAACHRRGIPVVDIQHGVAGRNMRAYAGWFNCPVGGYNTLPSDFLTWTPFDTNAIEGWSVFSRGAHRAHTSGNLWLSYAREAGIIDSSLKDWRGFIEKISEYKRKITITMQFDALASQVVRLIESRDSDLCFLIRVHPDSDMDSVGTYLSQIASKLNNVYFIEPTRMPIQVLMSISDVHITEWSACVYDAYFEGIKSIVLDSYGAEYFEDFIDSGYVVFLRGHDELRENIYNLDVKLGG